MSAETMTVVLLEWNRQLVGAAVVGTSSTMAFRIPARDIHTNELTLIGAHVRVESISLETDR